MILGVSESKISVLSQKYCLFISTRKPWFLSLTCCSKLWTWYLVLPKEIKSLLLYLFLHLYLPILTAFSKEFCSSYSFLYFFFFILPFTWITFPLIPTSFFLRSKYNNKKFLSKSLMLVHLLNALMKISQIFADTYILRFH